MRYVDRKCDTCKNDNALVQHIISKLFADMDSYGYVKQRRVCSMIKLCFDILQQCLDPNQLVRHAIDAERKL